MLEANKNACVVILDGCSIREIPKMMELSQISHRPVAECGVGFSAIPSATEYFVSNRVGFGFPVLGPSQILSNREWKECGIRYYYFQSPNESQHINDEREPVLIWHRFPDLRFMDSTASSAEFYDGIWEHGFSLAADRAGITGLPPGAGHQRSWLCILWSRLQRSQPKQG